jgi:ABC-type branched-subunit amino acid transport system ATPase component
MNKPSGEHRAKYTPGPYSYRHNEDGVDEFWEIVNGEGTFIASKRRQIIELTGLKDRSFTHASELAERRRRLIEVNAALERTPLPTATA